jgi:selenocysteine lyase/cysteine desulfurase
VALTPNATHGLHTAILGLDLQRGDEILHGDQEYSRAMAAIGQRCRRDGVIAVEAPLAAPAADPDEVARGLIERIGSRTRLIVLSQVTCATGQILPVAEVGKAAARRGVPMLVDAAHGFGLLPPTSGVLGAPFYTACLHKWLMGPIGTGVFTVQSPWLTRLWPLHPADDGQEGSAAKFEQWGTHAVAPFLALDEALDLHERLGRALLRARLDHLRAQMAAALGAHAGIRLLTDLAPDRSAAILAIAVDRAPAVELSDWLWREHRIHTATAPVAGARALRLSPHVFTSGGEIRRLVAALGAAATKGIHS